MDVVFFSWLFYQVPNHVNIRIVLLFPEKEMITNRSKYVIFPPFDTKYAL